LNCEGVRVHGPKRGVDRVFGAVSRPPPALVVLGLTPKAAGGYAPVAIASIHWAGERLTYSAVALESALDTLDSTRVSGDAQRALSRSLSRVATCLAARLEEAAGARLETPEWEPRLALPRRTLVVYPGRAVEVPAPEGAWLAPALWLAWAGRALGQCRGPDCPGLATLHAYASLYPVPELEKQFRRTVMSVNGIIPLDAAGGSEVEAAAVPGEGVSPAEYAAAAAAAGALFLAPPPAPRPVDRLALALAAFALARPR